MPCLQQILQCVRKQRRLKDKVTQHLNPFKKPPIYKLNLTTHAGNNNETSTNYVYNTNIRRGAKINMRKPRRIQRELH